MPKLTFIFFLIFISCHPASLKIKAVSDDFLHILHINEDTNVPSYDLDPSLSPYIQDFAVEATKRKHDISADQIERLRIFSYVDKLPDEVPPKVIGLCTRHTSYGKKNLKKIETKWLTINLHITKLKAYTGGDPIRLREVVFHELFHCFMNKSHLAPGVPGLMAPVLVKSPRVYTDWSGVLDEAFSKKYMEMIPDAN